MGLVRTSDPDYNGFSSEKIGKVSARKPAHGSG